MKKHRTAPTATSLPEAPEAQALTRLKRYGLTMGIRTLCFLLMAFVTPYGWYTWVFAAGAIFLPYVAVVFANAGESTAKTSRAEAPELALGSAPTAAPTPEQQPTVITLSETPPRAEGQT